MFASIADQRAAIKPSLARIFPEFRTGGDLYRAAIKQVLRPGMTVLDAGCGRGGIISEFRADIDRLIGVDIDRDALAFNRVVDEKLVNDLTAIELPEASVDLVVGEFVLEHLADPDRAITELKRVLKPGGEMIWLTPNVRHPVMALSRLTPRGWHDWWRKKVLHKNEPAHFAHYRANTPALIKALAFRGKIMLDRIELAGNPEYLAVTNWLVSPAVRLEKYLYTHRPDRQMYMVVVMKKNK